MDTSVNASKRFAQLVEQPHLACRLETAEAPEYLAIATHKAKELQFESSGRLTRAKADGLVAGLLARVRALDDEPKYA